MKPLTIQIAVSLSAVVVALVHVWWPALAIDGITVTLLLAAFVPWLAPLFRKLKMPGGWEIEFQDLQRAQVRAENAGLLATSDTTSASLTEYAFQIVADDDPNLALAGLRIEIERRLIQLAESNGIDDPRRGAGNLLRLLSSKDLLSREEQSVLSDLMVLLNQAVHGATVPNSASEWAMQIGPQLLQSLDMKVKDGRNPR